MPGRDRPRSGPIGSLIGRLPSYLLPGLLSGGLYALSLPKADLGWLAWGCLVPLFWWVLGDRPTARQALLAGLVSGLVAGTGRVYWIAETLGRYGGLGAAEAISTTALLVAYLALYPALFLWLCRRWRRTGWAFPWLAAAAWTLLDWVQTWMISGFPWALLGYTQYRSGAILQVAAVGGVHTLTFLLVLTNAALAHGLRRGRWLAVLSPAALLTVAALLYGTGRLQRLDAEAPAADLQVGVVQGNIGQDVKWEPRWKTATTRRYAELTRSLLEQGPALDLIVWPETALPFRLDAPENAARRREVVELAQRSQTPLLVGSLGSRSPSGRPGAYNRSFLFDAAGRVRGSTDKVHLVPFGEYLPFPWLFSYLGELTAQSGAFDPGEAHLPLALPGRAQSLFGVFICYESVFPSISRALVRSGAGFLVNTTNDAWFGTTAAPGQHLSMAVLRAVETGRPVIRAANTGISGLITPSGRVHSETGLFETALLRLPVRPRSEFTPYVRYGDVIFVVSGVILAIAAGIALDRDRRRRRDALATAGRQLQADAAAPRPLRRPVVLLPGYGSPVTTLDVLRAVLARTSGQPQRIHAIDLRHDLPFESLVAHTAAQLPAEPCDFVGHSLGGLVAAALALERADGARVCALSPPFSGTRWALLAARLGWPLPRLLRDLGPHSPALRRLRERLPELTDLWVVSLAGDPVSVQHRDRSVRDVPLLLGPLRRHRAVHRDPRVLCDVVRFLRDPRRRTTAQRPQGTG